MHKLDLVLFCENTTKIVTYRADMSGTFTEEEYDKWYDIMCEIGEACDSDVDDSASDPDNIGLEIVLPNRKYKHAFKEVEKGLVKMGITLSNITSEETRYE